MLACYYLLTEYSHIVFLLFWFQIIQNKGDLIVSKRTIHSYNYSILLFSHCLVDIDLPKITFRVILKPWRYYFDYWGFMAIKVISLLALYFLWQRGIWILYIFTIFYDLIFFLFCESWWFLNGCIDDSSLKEPEWIDHITEYHYFKIII